MKSFQRFIGLLVLVLTFCAVPSFASAATLYWYKTGVDANWETLTGNWWTNFGHTVQAGSLPGGSDTVLTLGTTSPQINLDTWVDPASIDATATGLAVNSPGGVGIGVGDLTMDVVGNVDFSGYAILGGNLNGNAVFRDSSRNYGSISNGHTVDFYDGTINVRSINGTVTFHDSSLNADDVTGTVNFYDSSANYTVGTVIGNATFHDSSQNQNTVTGTATFVGDTLETSGSVGANARKYVSNITTTRNFVTTGPWTIIADGAVVDISGAVYNGSTTLSAINGGSFNTMAPGCGTLFNRVGNTTYATRCGVTTVFSVDPEILSTSSSFASSTSATASSTTATSSSSTTATSSSTTATSTDLGALNSKKSGTQMAPKNIKHTFSLNIKFKDENSEVLELQKFLKSVGYLKVNPNGYFGPATRTAVISFQKENKLPTTGYFGPLSRGFVNAL